MVERQRVLTNIMLKVECVLANDCVTNQTTNLSSFVLH